MREDSEKDEARKSKTYDFQGIRDEIKSSFIRFLTLEIPREDKHFLYRFTVKDYFIDF